MARALRREKKRLYLCRWSGAALSPSWKLCMRLKASCSAPRRPRPVATGSHADAALWRRLGRTRPGSASRLRTMHSPFAQLGDCRLQDEKVSALWAPPLRTPQQQIMAQKEALFCKAIWSVKGSRDVRAHAW